MSLFPTKSSFFFLCRAVPLEAVCFISVATPHLGSWRYVIVLLANTYCMCVREQLIIGPVGIKGHLQLGEK